MLYYSPSKVANNILAFNSKSLVDLRNSALSTFTQNCFFRNSGSASGAISNNDLAADPVFETNSSRLSANSPCIDAGDDSFITPDMLDLAGSPRKQGAHVDIGAYEYTPPGYWWWTELKPEMVKVIPVTVGGITYAQYQFTLPDANYRLTEVGPTGVGSNLFNCRFTVEHWTGSGQMGTNFIAGAQVLGRLAAGDYTYIVHTLGVDVATAPFTVPAQSESMIQWSARQEANPWKLQILGVPNVTYRLWSSTNLMDWSAIATNRGGPFEYSIEDTPALPLLFYRVEVIGGLP